jgi:hypothetical protein
LLLLLLLLLLLKDAGRRSRRPRLRSICKYTAVVCIRLLLQLLLLLLLMLSTIHRHGSSEVRPFLCEMHLAMLLLLLLLLLLMVLLLMVLLLLMVVVVHHHRGSKHVRGRERHRHDNGWLDVRCEV